MKGKFKKHTSQFYFNSRLSGYLVSILFLLTWSLDLEVDYLDQARLLTFLHHLGLPENINCPFPKFF